MFIKPKQYVELTSLDVQHIVRDYLMKQKGYTWIDNVEFVVSHGIVNKVRCEFRDHTPIVKRIQKIAEERYANGNKRPFDVVVGCDAYSELIDELVRQTLFPSATDDYCDPWKQKQIRICTCVGYVGVLNSSTVDDIEIVERE